MKQRIKTKGWMAQTGGAFLIAVGIGCFILGLFTDIRIAGGQPVALMLAGGQATVLGVGLCCYYQLLIRTSGNEEALRFQYDIGYEAGWRDAERYDKPSLVDLDQYRHSVNSRP